MAASLGKHVKCLPKILSSQMCRRFSNQVFVDQHKFDPHNLYPLPTEGLTGLTDPSEIEALKKLDTHGYIEHFFETCEKTPTQEQIDHCKHEAPEDRYLKYGLGEEWGLNIFAVLILAEGLYVTLSGIGLP